MLSKPLYLCLIGTAAATFEVLKTEQLSSAVERELYHETLDINELNECLGRSTNESITFITFGDATVDGYTPFAPVMNLPDEITFEHMGECVNKQGIRGLALAKSSDLENDLENTKSLHANEVTVFYEWYGYNYHFDLENLENLD